MKYLITGLGNPGKEYENTRHNIGFKIVDALASTTCFSTVRYGEMAMIHYRGKTLLLLKPNTYMNLSGKAVKYWVEKETIDWSHLLVISDDLSLPFGQIRLRASGSDGGHNGLRSIIEHLATRDFPRLRFGIGNQFPKGQQVNYVLGEWNDEEKKALPGKIENAIGAVFEYVQAGLAQAMNKYNRKSG